MCKEPTQIPEGIRKVLVRLGLSKGYASTTNEVIGRVRYNFRGTNPKGEEVCVSGIIRGMKFSTINGKGEFALLPDCKIIGGKYQIHSFVYHDCDLSWRAILWPLGLFSSKKTIFPEIEGELKLEEIN